MSVILYGGFFLLGMVLDTVALRVAATRPLFGACYYGAWTVICTILAALDAAYGRWGWAAFMAAAAIINGIRCRRYWNRRKRRRAPALAGAKSRARVAALVRRVQSAAR